jgi:AraC family transcriptional regulator, alkane utilization regulator
LDRPDVISEVFTTLRIRSELYFRARLGGSSAIRIPRERRRIRFHLVLQGACSITAAGETPLALHEGDIALVPNGASQVISVAAAGAEPVALEALVADGAVQDGVLRHGAGAERASLLCGFCRFDEEIDHPVVANLPPLILLRASDLGTEPSLAATLTLVGLEAGLEAQGTTAILGRLIEIVVIQATRRLTSARRDDGNGFIAALADPSLSRALLAIHKAPERVWRVGDMARLAGMSRARFAERFAEAVGMPPIEYLTGWRLMRARALLAETALGIDDIAERCGYASLPSFSRRFKERFGVGPGAFRRRHRAAIASEG